MLFVSDFACFQLQSGKHAGKWKAVAQLRDDAGGKLRPKAIIRPGENEARAEMAKWLKGRARLLPSLTMTVDAMCDAYLARCESRGRAAKTVKEYRRLKDTYIKPAIGHLPVGKLKPSHVEAMIEELPVKTAVNTRAFLRSAINKIARKAEPSLPNVASLAEPPEYHPQEGVQLTPENFAKILQHETDPARLAMWLLLSDTGLRPHDEAGPLTWFEIHRRDDGWWIKLQSAKTDEGKKPVPISSETQAALGSLPKTGAYVFPSPRTGKPYDEATWRAYWEQAQTRAEVPVTNIYQLRHFFGTVQAKKVKSHVLARLMRHTDVRTTLRYYVDPFDADLRATKD